MATAPRCPFQDDRDGVASRLTYQQAQDLPQIIMKLTSAAIQNYRSIKDTVVEFDPRCRVLVGINESGKSNVLKALRLLSDDFPPSRVDDVREPTGRESPIDASRVRFAFDFEKADTDQIATVVSKQILSMEANPVLIGSPAKQSVKGLCSSRQSGTFQVDILTGIRGGRYWTLPGDHKIAAGWKKPSAACPADYTVNVHGIDTLLSTFKLVSPGEYADLIPAAYLESATIKDVDTLVGFAIVDVIDQNLPKVVFWEYREKDLLPSSVDLEEFATSPDMCVPLMNMFVLAGIPEGEIEKSIREKLKGSPNQIQNYFDQIADKTTAHFREVWEEYRNVAFSLRWAQTAIIPGIKEANTHDFTKRSDGFKRFVTFLLMISVKVKTQDMVNTLLLIDEPEISLHPSGARYLRNELMRIATKNYVVYSTHSIFMVDASNVERHYIVKKKGEVTSLAGAEHSNFVEEEVLWNALGYSTFDVLKEKNIIFEGWRDKRLFQVAVGNANASLISKFKDVGICHVKGASSVKSSTPAMELAKRQCLIVSDGDTAALQEQKLYKAAKGYGIWLTYQGVDASITALTGEDFVKKKFVVAAVNEVLKSQSMPTFTEADLPSHTDKVKEIKQWLADNGIAPPQVKPTMNEIKDYIFEALEATHIEDEYAKLIKGIADKLA